MQTIVNLVTQRARMVIAISMAVVILVSLGGFLLKEKKNLFENELPNSLPEVREMERGGKYYSAKDYYLWTVEGENFIETLRAAQEVIQDLKETPGVINDEITSLLTTVLPEPGPRGLRKELIVGEIPATPEEEERLKEKIRNTPLVYGRLVSRDFSRLLIRANLETVKTDEKGEKIKGSGYDQTIIRNSAVRTKEKRGNVYPSGEPVYNEEIRLGTQGNAQRLIPLALLVSILVFWFSLKTWRGVNLASLIVILTILVTIGTMGFLGIEWGIITSVVPAILIVISNSYGVHLLSRYQEGESEQPVRDSVKGVGPALLITAVTTAIGFSGFVTFRVKSLTHLGFLVAAGTLAAIFFTIVLTPAILRLLKAPTGPIKPVSSRTDRLGKILKAVGTFSFHKGKVLLIGFVCLAIISLGLAWTKLKIGADPFHILPQGHYARESVRVFSSENPAKDLGGLMVVKLVVVFKEEGGGSKPETLGKIWQFQKKAEEITGSYSDSFVDELMLINQKLNDNKKEFHCLPRTQETIEQYHSAFGRPQDYEELVDPLYDSLQIFVRIRTTDQREQIQIVGELRKLAHKELGDIAKEINFTGNEVMFWTTMNKLLGVGTLWNSSLALVIVFGITAAFFRSWKMGLLCVVPLLFAKAFTLGIMALWGIRLNIATAIIYGVAVGIGTDYPVHWLSRFREFIRKGFGVEEAIAATMATSGKAIVWAAATDVFGFSVLLFSTFTPISDLGWLTILVVITCNIGTDLLLPYMIRVIKPK